MINFLKETPIKADPDSFYFIYDYKDNRLLVGPDKLIIGDRPNIISYYTYVPICTERFV